MPAIPFSRLPDHARLWTFAAARALSGEETARLEDEVDRFLATWAAHGTPLTSGREIRYDRFLLVGVDEQAAGVSGCSIDALVRALRGLEQDFGTALLDNGPVLYRDGDTIRRVTRAEFHALAARGAVTPDTIVFDNTVATVGAVRADGWEAPARTTWHGRVFFESAAAD